MRGLKLFDQIQLWYYQVTLFLQLIQVDSMKGDLRGVDYESSDEEDEVVQEEERVVVANTKKG